MNLTIAIEKGMVCCATLASWLYMGRARSRALRPLTELAAWADENTGGRERASIDVVGQPAEVHPARRAMGRALLGLRENHGAIGLFVANVAHELPDSVTTVLAKRHGPGVLGQRAGAREFYVRLTRAELAAKSFQRPRPYGEDRSLRLRAMILREREDFWQRGLASMATYRCGPSGIYVGDRINA